MKDKEIKYRGLTFKVRESFMNDYEYFIYIGDNKLASVYSVKGLENFFNILDKHCDYFQTK